MLTPSMPGSQVSPVSMVPLPHGGTGRVVVLAPVVDVVLGSPDVEGGPLVDVVDSVELELLEDGGVVLDDVVTGGMEVVDGGVVLEDVVTGGADVVVEGGLVVDVPI